MEMAVVNKSCKKNRGGKPLNGRERIETVLKGQIPDRVPASFFVQEEFLNYCYPGRQVDRVATAVECARHFDFEIMTRSKQFEVRPYFLKKNYLNWEVHYRAFRESGNHHEVFEITTPLKKLRQVQVTAVVDGRIAGVPPMTAEYLVKDEADLEAFVKYVPALDIETREEMKAYCRWSKQIIGPQGISAPWTWGGVYNKAAEFRDISLLLTDPYLNPDFYGRYMEKITGLAAAIARELALANGDAISIAGNIANAGIVGRDFFDQYIRPYEKQVLAAAAAAGSFTIYHNCGKAEVLQRSYADMGVTAWETVAEPPHGDNDLARAKQNVGGRLTLIGNLDQVHFLKKAAPREVALKVEQLIKAGKPGGRYIFACADFLEKDTPLANIAAAISAARTWGNYNQP